MPAETLPEPLAQDSFEDWAPPGHGHLTDSGVLGAPRGPASRLPWRLHTGCSL
jgi:hypothetical protein